MITREKPFQVQPNIQGSESDAQHCMSHAESGSMLSTAECIGLARCLTTNMCATVHKLDVT